MLSTILLQAGTLRKAAAVGVYKASQNPGFLEQLLSSGLFWGIVVFIVVCVVIYNLLKD